MLLSPASDPMGKRYLLYRHNLRIWHLPFGLDIYPFGGYLPFQLDIYVVRTWLKIHICRPVLLTAIAFSCLSRDAVLSVGFLLDCSLPFELLQSVLHLLRRRYFVLKLKRRPLIGKDYVTHGGFSECRNMDNSCYRPGNPSFYFDWFLSQQFLDA